MWKLRIEQYFQVQDYALWDVIENGNSFTPVPRTIANADGTSTSTIPESLDSIFNRLQRIVSQLPIMDLDTMIFDDLYNNFKMLNKSNNEVDTTNIQVNILSTPVSNASSKDSTTNLSDATIYAFLANQPNGSQLVHKDLEQIHKDDLEEMDMKWQLALLSMRAKRWDIFQENVECQGIRKVGQGIKKPQEGL
ncbi:hypothetical protein Tco_1243839 [Tanacetum coccineum]